MFVKCGRCGYLTPDGTALCKQCGAVVSAPIEPVPPAEPAPAPVDGPTSWPPATMPPPDPSSAAPGWRSVAAPPPPPPPTPLPPAMYPGPGARPPRRSLPAWSYVAGSLALVGVLLIVGVLATRTDGTSAAQARRAQAQLDTQQAEITSIEATMLTQPDLGGFWNSTGPRGIAPEDLAWNDTCSDAPGLASTATVGRTVDFQHAAVDGHEDARASVTVRAYRSAEDAAAQLDARLDPSFKSCVAQYDVADVECICHLKQPAVDMGVELIPAPSDVHAVVYRDTVAYDEGQGVHLYHVLRAYLAHGRYQTLVILEGPTDPNPAQFDTMLRTVSQRLDLHAPTS